MDESKINESKINKSKKDLLYPLFDRVKNTKVELNQKILEKQKMWENEFEKERYKYQRKIKELEKELEYSKNKTHPNSPVSKFLYNEEMKFLKKRNKKLENLNNKLYPIHRLDMDTSGCLIIAKNKKAASKYSKLFFENKIEKIYYVITYGHFNSPYGIILNDIKVKGKNKKAETYYKVIKKFAKYSLIEIKIKTGRMHQISIHFNKINHPIIDDDKYGNFS